MLDRSQQFLVEQNHNLIYGFAQKKKLDVDEYYGLLAISLCKAAEAYQESRGKFTTFAYMVMENDLNKYWRTTQNQKSIPQEMIVSYNAENESSNTPYLENIVVDSNDMDFHMQYNDMLSQMNSIEKIICQMLMDGAKQSDILKRLGITKRQYEHIRQKLRNKYHNMWY